ncbi:unnamed protein product [Acanthoscelides obtectus]|uniref:Uncharacterized protein n=1 Tax=Acanthoscelides obtectus TaxID=200917 RepID=A0A9P0LKY6_ACAOB|nr:unnamed protein product [Acanthoscelides obtectus]CAK1664352.1 hypothetical protein AOBTE_LOCUS24215 [Acanthoscelides obtectus]
MWEQLEDKGLLKGMDEKQLKNKIKNLKDVFRQELAKIERSKKTQHCKSMSFAEIHSNLAKDSVGLGGRSKETINRKWDKLAICLNTHGSGPTKNGQCWRKYWIDLKHRIQSRAAQYRQGATGTGGGC